ncbi:MAG: glutamate--cysteine ligase [Synechococcus sp. MED-G71]|nr:MAG: glutamate--cysteine ligase [Synechococcus sp. MED-G71]|tara:strand:+ start:5902 stop:7041 length:1140 start_codon:yes stop_codon:yes gene_type:complete
MSAQLLKGFEVEMYTGRADGTVVGCSSEAAAALPEVVTEPDCRNLEYITPPEADYSRQLQHLLQPRQRLRHWLASRQLTLLPGSTLSLGNSQRFERSDPQNPYHQFIEDAYGTRVVTASVHINLGLEDSAAIMAACRLLRCEASLLLALSASSPFLDGRTCGAHSQRWRQFPLTPATVPLFRDQGHYIAWMQEQLATGAMRNVRHFWGSVRPNGPERPHQLNRVELRICDLVTDPLELLAITAFCELRLLQLIEGHCGDPASSSALNLKQLAELADANDQQAALQSLDATLHHWQDGSPLVARQWIASQLQQLKDWGQGLEPCRWLEPIEALLDRGNTAMRWLQQHAQGESISSILSREATLMQSQEQALSSTAGADLG